MDRRDFIRRGAVGASGVVAGGGVRPPSPTDGSKRPAGAVDMTAYLKKVDAGLERIAQWPLSESFGEVVGDSGPLDALGRKSFHSLYMTGMFGDLPVEGQLDTRMQDRMWAAQPVMDEALAEMQDFLSGQTPEQLSRLRSTLRERPEVLRNIVSTLEEEAARSGVSESRRAQLRTMFSEVGWRLENQPPPLIVGEYLGKIEKVSASDIESEARQRWLAARVGEDAFWQAQASLRDRRISRGLKAMGIGALLFIAGLVLVSVSDGDVSGDGDALLWIGLIPGITVGSIFFVVGLIILLVGASTSADVS